MSFQVTSTAFQHQGNIPAKYTCDGEDVSPSLHWTAGPQGTVSYALVMDAPAGTWVHWIAWNITSTSLDEAIQPQKELPGGGSQGINSWKKAGYGGPCPPSGIHRYFFRIYALDTNLSLLATATKPALLDAMKGHVLGQGELMGKYTRRR